MSNPVLGRDPFERTTRPTAPPPLPEPELAAPAGLRSAVEAARPDEVNRARTERRSPRSRAARSQARASRKTSAAISQASRKAVAGVVREAQAARKARAQHHDVEPATAPLPVEPMPAHAFVPRAVQDDHIDLFGMSPSALARAEPVLRFLYDEYFRIQLDAVDAVPPTGRALVVANHAGSLPLDALMLMTGLRRTLGSERQVRALVEDSIWHAPFVGMGMSRLGGVRADQDNAERLLREDQLVIVFPEGQLGLSKLYRDRYKLQRFGRGGFVKLAMRTGSPIVPAAVLGSEEIYPLLAKITRLVKTLGVPYIPITPTFPWLGALGVLPLPSKWRVQFGEPIDMSRYGEGDCQDVTLVHSITEQVRERIQGMVNGLLATRESVLFG